ncbi:hypothetical protein EJ06DRAFT_381339 [Trichodelitschia bisporula]|uniref:F-box domain-containing protein n=1 Tax=Trichodelitschia bisporula TaxID=703511 RepID=A0A6G1HZD9_9PEZI|nr:hypothetical protein EJ06DRAFT_381339 [Trichodelitschia bisporula]
MEIPGTWHRGFGILLLWSLVCLSYSPRSTYERNWRPAPGKATMKPPTLLTLPPELLTQIITHLLPPPNLDTVLHLRAKLGISNASHTPPPLSLLLASRKLHIEALATYFRLATFTLEGLLDAPNIAPLWGVEERLARAAVLRRVRRVCLSLFWHPVLGVGAGGKLGGYAAVLCAEVERRRERVARAVEVLRQAEDLRVVEVGWMEVPRRRGEEGDGEWEWALRRRVLEPLGELQNRGVRFVVGDVCGGREVEGRFAESVGYLDKGGFVGEVSGCLVVVWMALILGRRAKCGLSRLGAVV